MIKKRVRVGKLIKKTAGGKHAWYESNVGDVRKPILPPLKTKEDTDYIKDGLEGFY